MQLDFERIRIMYEVYEDTVGYQQIIRRAKFLAEVLDRKKLYIDDNLFVGSLAGSLNAIYTHPEWNVVWMKEENTVEKSVTEEDHEANAWALDYWDRRSLKTRTEQIFERKYGYSPVDSTDAGLFIGFHDWPGGGGNLNYPIHGSVKRIFWEANPIRIGAYIQDKLEFEGMIANIGVRLDYSNARAQQYDLDPYSPFFYQVNKWRLTTEAPSIP